MTEALKAPPLVAFGLGARNETAAWHMLRERLQEALAGYPAGVRLIERTFCLF
jgi:hypothetical protein